MNARTVAFPALSRRRFLGLLAGSSTALGLSALGVPDLLGKVAQPAELQYRVRLLTAGGSRLMRPRFDSFAKAVASIRNTKTRFLVEPCQRISVDGPNGDV